VLAATESMYLVGLALCLLSAIHVVCCKDWSGKGDIVLLPNGTSTDSIGILFFKTDFAEPKSYEQLWESVQAASEKNVYVAIGEYLPETAYERLLIMDRLANTLHTSGLPFNAPLLVSGHGKGGDAAQLFVAERSSFAEGLILLASYPTKKTENMDIPVLSVAGELDGVVRIANFAAVSAFPTRSDMYLAVAYDVTHDQFCDGVAISVAGNNIKPEISLEEAHARIVKPVSSFIDEIRDNKRASVRRQHAAATELLRPLVKALLLESNRVLAPPCYEKTADPVTCFDSLPFASWAQESFAGTAVKINNTAIFMKVDQIFPHDYLPKIENKCAPGTLDCVLMTSTVSQPMYQDDGLVAAQEIAIKLNSRCHIYEFAGLPPPPAPATCHDVNVGTWEWALSQAPDRTLARLQRRGRMLRMAPDHIFYYLLYPLYDTSHLQFVNAVTADGTAVVDVIASSITFQNTPIKFFNGLQFCKLLSPARALEWIYTDGLRDY